MSSTSNQTTAGQSPHPSTFGYPKHLFCFFSQQEAEERKSRFLNLLGEHFPKSAEYRNQIQELPDGFEEGYFGSKFARLLYSSAVLEAALQSDLTASSFDDFLEIVLETFSIRSQETMAGFESLGLLDHYMTLQKFAEADLPSFTIEGMLSFGEMAPIRNILGLNKSERFWQRAQQSLTETLENKGTNEFVAFIKQSLQMPHRIFRPHDINNIGSDIEQAFRPPVTKAEQATSYDDAIQNWKSPEDIVKWAGKNYSYDFDRGSIMSGSNELTVYKPNEFFDRGSGVCIDFSFFIFSTLSRINPKIKPYMFRMQYEVPNNFRGNPFISHWSAAYELDGQWYVLGDSKLGGMISGPYKSLTDYREDYSRYRGLKYVRHDLYDDLSLFYGLPR